MVICQTRLVVLKRPVTNLVTRSGLWDNVFYSVHILKHFGDVIISSCSSTVVLAAAAPLGLKDQCVNAKVAYPPIKMTDSDSSTASFTLAANNSTQAAD